MKRLTALLLSALLCFNLLCVSALAEGNVPNEAKLPAVLIVNSDRTVDGSRLPEGMSLPGGIVFGYLTIEDGVRTYSNPRFCSLSNGQLSGPGSITNDYDALKDSFYNDELIDKVNGLVAGIDGNIIPVIFREAHTGHADRHITEKSDTTHTTVCKWCGGDEKTIAHTVDTWTNANDDENHNGECTVCGYSVTEKHDHLTDGYCTKCDYAETTIVTFDTDGGSAVADMPGQTCGKPLTKAPEEPTKDSFKFAGWLKDGKPFNVATGLVTKGMKLTASWAADLYTVTIKVNDDKMGSAEIVDGPADGKIASGKKVTVQATPSDEKKYEVDQIVIEYNGEEEEVAVTKSGKGTFTMPSANVTVNVYFKKAGSTGDTPTPSGKYKVTVNYGEGGKSVKATPDSGADGTEVTVTIEAKDGFEIMSAYVNDKEVEQIDKRDNGKTGTFVFTIEKEDAHVEVQFKRAGTPDYILDDTKTETPVEGAKDDTEKTELEKSEVTLPKTQAGEYILKATSKLLQEALNIFKDAKQDEITFIAKPQLTIEITGRRTNPDAPVLRMDITGIIQMYARRNDNPETDRKLDASETMRDPVTLRVALPGFKNERAYVSHKGYRYFADPDDGLFKFRNPHGFSRFEFTQNGDPAVVLRAGYDYAYMDLDTLMDEEGDYRLTSKDVLTFNNRCEGNLRLPKGVTLIDEHKYFSGTINGVRNPFGDETEYTVPTNGTSSGSGSGSSGNGANGKPSVVPGTGGTAPVEPGNPRSRFLDVAYGAFYFDAVEWAAANGITKGKDTGYFAPNESCTRAEMVTFLWRAAGSPEPTTSSAKFTDVEAGKYYEKAVAWAVEKGITQGVSATSFAPNATVTRDQTVTFIYRSKGSPAASGATFSDVPANAYYANAVAWAVQAGVTNGTSATTFSPAKNCTRGEIVTFLYRSK